MKTIKDISYYFPNKKIVKLKKNKFDILHENMVKTVEIYLEKHIELIDKMYNEFYKNLHEFNEEVQELCIYDLTKNIVINLAILKYELMTKNYKIFNGVSIEESIDLLCKNLKETLAERLK